MTTLVSGKRSDDLAGGLQAAFAGQTDVHQHHLRVKTLDRLQSLLSRPSFTDHFHVGLVIDEGFQSQPHQGMIVNQYHWNL